MAAGASPEVSGAVFSAHRGLMKALDPADYPGMAIFWTWFVRNPCFLFGGIFLAGGALSIIEWSLSLVGLMVFALVGDAAHHLGRRARKRAEARKEVEEHLEEAKLMRGRFSAQKGSRSHRAA